MRMKRYGELTNSTYGHIPQWGGFTADLSEVGDGDSDD